MEKIDKLTLVVLAAGMGSRYGGLKQIDTFSAERDTIIDFSLYDAIQAGFNKVVFIIRKSFEKEFKNIFNKKLEGKVEVVYVYQEIDAVPNDYQISGRTKPWGTGHALLMVKDVVKENFAIINADDFYSKEAFEVMVRQLKTTDPNTYSFSMVAYLLKNTVSEYGYVSRGECTVSNGGFLTGVTERLHIERIEGELMRKDEKNNLVSIDEEATVSMNFWGFTPKCFDFSQKLFRQFLDENKEDPKSEFFIPYIVNEFIKSSIATVKVLKSNAKWFGVTYKEDKIKAIRAIGKLKKDKVYPKYLWN
ncbi:nucleotidyltransferase family protein [Tenacibaculum xiamenense]|uniref:nucleotidyltransferase family protein n=1 Tax=Tenacibaculum xiamenense TaxID=1261553 RepID=UPI003895812A